MEVAISSRALSILLINILIFSLALAHASIGLSGLREQYENPANKAFDDMLATVYITSQ
ncbi:hypothetical protein BDV32DRAFT_123959 [Aspergillus pseudonomiae]|nr:hypothetical protein BDV32DRAFT_123959 [Aspergillus pseudonomiae]